MWNLQVSVISVTYNNSNNKLAKLEQDGKSAAGNRGTSENTGKNSGLI